MVDRPGKNFSIILTNHGHFGLFSTSLKFERGRPRWILSDSRSTWKIQIVSKRMQNAINVSAWGGAGQCTVKLHGTACVRILTYPLFLQWAIRQVLLSTTDRTDRTDSLVEERDQKVSVGLGGVPPWAFRHRLCSRRVLAAPYGATPSPAMQDLPSPQKTK